MINEMQSNIRGYLNSLIESKGQLESQLYNINTASQLAVDMSKSHAALGSEERQEMLLNELYAALKTRCTSGTKLLMADFLRRQRMNELADLDNLVVHSPHCSVTMHVMFPDDVVVAAADSPAQTGMLKESSLAVFQDGVIIGSWPVVAMEPPFEPLLALSPCFSFQYLGHPVMLCASSSVARDQWIHALIFNWYCLKKGIGKGFDTPQNMLKSSDILQQKPPKQVAPEAPSEESTASTTTTTPLPGIMNLFVGIKPDSKVIFANDRESLERALLKTN